MNNLKALKGEITPYSVGKDLLEKTLLDAGLNPLDPYVSVNASLIARASCQILSKFLVLSSETDDGSEQEYNLDRLSERIKGICGKWGFDQEEFLGEYAVQIDNNHVW